MAAMNTPEAPPTTSLWFLPSNFRVAADIYLFGTSARAGYMPIHHHCRTSEE